MLYDIKFGQDGVNHPGFFDATIRNGALHCDAMSADANGDPPITVHGWHRESEVKA